MKLIAMLFYPNDEYTKDQTNWFGLSVEAIASMLENVGFEVNKIILSQEPSRYLSCYQNKRRDIL